MKPAFKNILLLAVPGLMFCIIPVNGLEFDFMWQMAALWIAGLAFTLWLSSWWFRAFFFLALVRTATIWPPDADGYISLLMIAIFLAAAEGFKRIDSDDTMNFICIAGVALFAWLLAQLYGFSPAYFGGRSIGGLNPDAGGVSFALCLIAFFRMNSYQLIWVPVVGIIISGSTTALTSALAGVAALLILDKRISIRQFTAAFVVLVIVGGFWLWKIDPLQNTLKCDRWIAWKHAAWSLRSEALGRGLGSWKIVFPLLASSDKRLGQVSNENGTITIDDYFRNAHNQYVQTAFELGIQELAIAVAFLIFAAVMALAGRVGPYPAAGVMALAVACFGWNVFHSPLLAVLGSAWLGMFERERSFKCV